MEKSMTNGIKVQKRNGRIEGLALDKMHLMVGEACRGLSGVSASQVEMTSGIQFYDGITTDEIQEILIRSASDLISLEAPNYQYVAARLLLFSIRKKIFGGTIDIPHLEDHINNCVSLKIYDHQIYDYYSKEDIDKVNSYIDHDRDFLFTYAGLRQVVDKYLVQDRSTGKLYETPQFMYIMIALTMFSRYPKETRLSYIKRYYDAISKHKINIPTPVPFLKKFEATVRCCTQNGIRGGSATVHFPIWHQEIEDIIVLKNNKGTEDNRVRKLDYSIQFSKIFYERFIKNEEITLFSPNDVPGLYDNFGLPTFDDLYVSYENNPSIPKKKVKAQELILNVLKERAETGRIYIMNIDHCNSHSSYKDQITMSNLCQEITEPTTPIQHIDDDNYAEIATCILSAINVGKVKSDEELEELCDLTVRSLDELIDYQEYPVKAAENFTKRRRSLGIGYIGLAHYLAKLGFNYDSQEAWDAVHGLSESFQYYLLKASNQLAKEKGYCEYFGRTKYADGILPVDTYKKDVDEISSIGLEHDWETLRASILEYGLRHSTLSAQMPSESSSVVSNATNGIEPPRGYLSIKKSKKGPLKQIVPQYHTLKNNYTLLWDMGSNRGYINIVAVMQKFFDQAISGNWSYNPENYPDNEVPVSVMANDFLTTYKYGHKTAYYQNTYDIKTDEVAEEPKQELQSLLDDILESQESDCESCTI